MADTAGRNNCNDAQAFLRLKHQTPQLLDHEVLLFIAQQRKQRQADGFGVITFSLGEVTFGKPQVAIVRLQMHRNVVQVYTDPGRSQAFEHLSMAEVDPIRLQPHHVQMPRRLGLGLRARQGQRQVRQQSVITRRQLTTTLDEVIELIQL